MVMENISENVDSESINGNIKADSDSNDRLVLVKVVKRDRCKGIANDKRRVMNHVIASYKDKAGVEFRKGFNNYGKVHVPLVGTHELLNSKKLQFNVF